MTYVVCIPILLSVSSLLLITVVRDEEESEEVLQEAEETCCGLVVVKPGNVSTSVSSFQSLCDMLCAFCVFSFCVSLALYSRVCVCVCVVRGLCVCVPKS